MKFNRQDQLAEIGARIKALRRKLRLSQGALAAQLGVSYQQLQKYEKGESPIPSDRLLFLARELGVSVSELLGSDAFQIAAPRMPGNVETKQLLASFRRIGDPRLRQILLACAQKLASL